MPTLRVVTLVLYLMPALLWIQSERRPVRWLLASSSGRPMFIASSRGRLMLWSQGVSPKPPEYVVVDLNTPQQATVSFEDAGTASVKGYRLPFRTISWGGSSSSYGFGSVQLENMDYRFSFVGWHFMIAWWLMLVPGGGLILLKLVRWSRRRKKNAASLCVHCSYDLRVTPGQCPECGATA